MPALSCLIHTRNNERSLGRTLETIHCADEVVIIDQGSTDRTVRIAKEYGAKVVLIPSGASSTSSCRHDWILALQPNESLHEALEASLFEWKSVEPHIAESFSLPVREQVGRQWYERAPETRLMNRRHIDWTMALPPAMANSKLLAGPLLRFID